jgi:polysaccharide biosynthesis protein PslH
MPRPVLLYVASRWPWPVRTGRQRMIDQAIRFAGATHEVHLAVHSSSDLPAAPDGLVASVVRLPAPSAPEALLNLLGGRCATLQDSLFTSAAGRRAVDEAAARLKPDVAVYDMARMAAYGLGRPSMHGGNGASPPVRCRRILDLDDLLSNRYAEMAQSRPGALLGAFGDRMPKAVQVSATVLPSFLAGLESRLMTRRENALTGLFDAVSLVSSKEADELSQRTGATNVVATPPAIDRRGAPMSWNGTPPRFVFLGAAAYGPNAEALLMLDAVAELLAARGRPVTFDAFGEPNRKLRLRRISVNGYLPDLDQALGPGAVLVAPIQAGTGVKTKVLEAMSRGVPVITTDKGVEGLAIEPGIHAVVTDGIEGFADAVEAALADPGRMERIGLSGYRYAAARHDPAAVEEAFHALLRGGSARARPK